MWALLGFSWALLGLSWALLGLSWDLLGLKYTAKLLKINPLGVPTTSVKTFIRIV